jgi:hypothetical protein
MTWGRNMSDKVAKLSLDGKTYDLPVHKPTLGPDVLDIRKLYGEADVFTYDPGFTSTAACESAITYIDGDKGELLYRGYPIEQLAEKSTHLEVCYLLLYGELPTSDQLADFTGRVTKHTMVHEQMHYFFRGFRRDAHPMATMVGVVGAMAAFYHDSTDITDPWQREVAAIRMIAKLPTIAAMAYKYSVGQPFVYPKNALSYSGNFLQMCFAVPAEDYVVNPVLEKAMDRIMMLHADHRRLGVQVFHWPAVRLSAQQPRLLVELPEHVLRGPGRGVRGRPDPVAGDGPHLYPARGSRAERLDLDRAAGVFVGSKSVRVHRGGRGVSLGPGTWRSERGRVDDAARDQDSGSDPRVHRASQGQG